MMALKRLFTLVMVVFSLMALRVTMVFAQEKTYSIGIVPQFEAKTLRSIWQPIVNYLNDETGYHFKIKGSPTIDDFEREIKQGSFDFAYMNPYHLLLAHEQNGYVPLVRDIGKTLQGILVVKKESGITDPVELSNQTIAFPSPNALGASLLMREELHGVFKLKFYPRYVKTHDSVYLNVLLGETKAGGGVLRTLKQQPIKYQSALSVIHTTKPVAAHPFSVHPRVNSLVVDAVRQAFLKLGESAEGRTLLSKIPIKTIGVSKIEDYDSLKVMNLKRFEVR